MHSALSSISSLIDQIECNDEGKLPNIMLTDEYLLSSCKSCYCHPTFRMRSALIFYSTIDPINNTKHAQKLLQYVRCSYVEILNDYIHIMEHHQNNIDQIQEKMKIDIYLMEKCDIEKCMKSVRHYRDRDTSRPLFDARNNQLTHQDRDEHLEHDLVFYVDLLDSIHVLWFHSFELGLRSHVMKDDFKYITNDSTVLCKINALRKSKLIGKKFKGHRFTINVAEQRVNEQGILIPFQYLVFV